MSARGRPQPAPIDGSALRVAVLAGEWHASVMAGLIEGAERALADAQVAAAEVVRAPGSFELPVLAQGLVNRGFDAVVALGVVIRGGTPHFEYVCDAVTHGLARVALDSGVPVGFGVLTCDSEEQALARAGLQGSDEDKGYEAAHAAMSTAITLRGLARA
ncbi:MAG: 6,7-dimethyl-8-ribityllumazine synthase [Nocardioidaceae bacterium]|nr:6,7-dimethyl-8-ribityllumazine synthase [Nocardioidaceae bacterium]